MELDSFAAEISREAHLVWDAPWISLASLAILGVGIWKAVEWQYAARLARLRQDVLSEQAEIVRLRAKLGDASEKPAAKPDLRGASVQPRKASASIEIMQRAKDNATLALSRKTARHAEQALPSMKAALLTAHKAFGIPELTDEEVGYGPVLHLDYGRRMLECVLPLLRAGHEEEARLEAAALLKHMHG